MCDTSIMSVECNLSCLYGAVLAYMGCSDSVLLYLRFVETTTREWYEPVLLCVRRV